MASPLHSYFLFSFIEMTPLEETPAKKRQSKDADFLDKPLGGKNYNIIYVDNFADNTFLILFKFRV